MRCDTRTSSIRTLLVAGVVLLTACLPPTSIGLGVVYVDEAPPPPRVEVIAARPGPEFVWVAGYWSWDDDYVWVPGHWERPPRRDLHWVSGRWRRGSHHRWYWEPGHWR